jgi:SAP domain-containing new25/Domain of unknown function (DUF6434)
MLSPITTINEFQTNYYYRKDLMVFCKQNKIPYSGLLKIDLERNITLFLSGNNNFIKSKIKGKKWIQDKLDLNSEVTINYRSNEETRQFFVSIIGKKFRFCGAIMNYKKNNPDKYVTYQDLVNVWYEEQKNRKLGKSSTEEFYKTSRYNKFIASFYHDPKNKGKTHKQMIEAWQEFKNSGLVNL